MLSTGVPGRVDSEADPPLVGLFVGGRGTRMGGADKGNLRLSSGERLVERLEVEARAALPGAPLVLVGEAAPYADLGLPALADSPAGVGPLGGLRALLVEARACGRPSALVLACDLPYVTRQLMARLSWEAPSAAFLAPREGRLWHTLTARYAVSCLPALDAALEAGDLALQRLVARLGSSAVELPVTPSELLELRDWDKPEDLLG